MFGSTSASLSCHLVSGTLYTKPYGKNCQLRASIPKWQPTTIHCPLDGAIESINHTMTLYRFLPFTFDTIGKCFRPVDIDGTTVRDVKTLLENHLSDTLGESLYSARTARALRATFRLCSPRRAPKHIPWKCPSN